MEFVQPLRSRADIARVKEVLKSRNLRDYTLFVLGIYTGLRISDLLKLKVKDVAREEKKKLVIRESLSLREMKTGKAKIIVLNKTARSALKQLLRRASPDFDDPLFISRKKDREGKLKAIQRCQAYLILNRAAREAGITERIGTHTLRKTFGYHNYRKGFDITKLQQIFNHASPAVTLAYIGFTQDEIDEAYINLDY